ncbi:MAG: FMN-binding protein [Spirochaetia bacterium]|jgi:uncharacterized protein with FMN-binding domain|nr:FMN-binding protein [Spirochaetia bacterium]
MKLSKHTYWYLVIGLLLLSSCLYGFHYTHKIAAYRKAVAEISISDVNIPAIPNGTYIGECNVDLISAKVQVTMQDGRIVDIILLKHKNGHGTAAETIPDKIVSEQRIDIDAISGATNSSEVIEKAIENALTSDFETK